jgi:hypothetical protein
MTRMKRLQAYLKGRVFTPRWVLFILIAGTLTWYVDTLDPNDPVDVALAAALVAVLIWETWMWWLQRRRSQA